jgi:hypothetical protein
MINCDYFNINYADTCSLGRCINIDEINNNNSQLTQYFLEQKKDNKNT